MRSSSFALLTLFIVSACGDDGDDGNGQTQTNPQIHAYCEANCKRNTECDVEALAEGEECVALCEGLTLAFGNCSPSQAVVDACIAAIEKNSCEAQRNDEEPAECEAICEQ
jgi:hypothetical protein